MKIFFSASLSHFAKFSHRWEKILDGYSNTKHRTSDTRVERCTGRHTHTFFYVLIGKWAVMQNANYTTAFAKAMNKSSAQRKLSGSSYDSFARITSIFIWRNAFSTSNVNEKVATIKLDYISEGTFSCNGKWNATFNTVHSVSAEASTAAAATRRQRDSINCKKAAR